TVPAGGRRSGLGAGGMSVAVMSRPLVVPIRGSRGDAPCTHPDPGSENRPENTGALHRVARTGISPVQGRAGATVDSENSPELPPPPIRRNPLAETASRIRAAELSQRCAGSS